MCLSGLNSECVVVYIFYFNLQMRGSKWCFTIERYRGTLHSQPKNVHGHAEMWCSNVCAVDECLEQCEALKALTEEECLQLLTESRKGRHCPDWCRQTVQCPWHSQWECTVAECLAVCRHNNQHCWSTEKHHETDWVHISRSESM